MTEKGLCRQVFSTMRQKIVPQIKGHLYSLLAALRQGKLIDQLDIKESCF